MDVAEAPESLVVSGVPTAVPVYNISTYRLPGRRRSWPRSSRGVMALSEVLPHRHADKNEAQICSIVHVGLLTIISTSIFCKDQMLRSVKQRFMRPAGGNTKRKKYLGTRVGTHDLILSDKLEKGTPQSPSTIRTLQLASQLGVQPALENFKNSSS